MKITPSVTAYNLLRRRLYKIYPYFEDLHFQLKKAGIAITYKAYVSLMILISAITFCASITISLAFIPTLLNVSFFSLPNFLLSFLLAGLAGVFTLIIIYIYPNIKANGRKIPIENNLPYISSFLTLLSSSNVAPSVIFRSVARIDTLSEVRQEFTNIIRDIELFGKDLMTSILENAAFTPNEKLRELLIGYVATVRTGGNPTEYLKISNESITRERMGKLDMMLESLSAIAEIYVMVLVAMPLLFVVLFATLGMIGGGGTGLNPSLFLYLLTYLGIPIMGTVMMVIVSTLEK